MQQVGAVDRGRRDIEKYVPGRQVRVGLLGPPENFWTTGFGGDDCIHVFDAIACGASEETITPLAARSPARSYRAVTGSGRRHYTPGVTSERDEPKWLTAKEQEAWRLYMDGNNRLMSASVGLSTTDTTCRWRNIGSWSCSPKPPRAPCA